MFSIEQSLSCDFDCLAAFVGNEELRFDFRTRIMVAEFDVREVDVGCDGVDDSIAPDWDLQIVAVFHVHHQHVVELHGCIG